MSDLLGQGGLRWHHFECVETSETVQDRLRLDRALMSAASESQPEGTHGNVHDASIIVLSRRAFHPIGGDSGELKRE